MDYEDVEILFAEDTVDDATLTMRALRKSGITNKIHHVEDGAEALDFMYCLGIYSTRNIQRNPKLILLDLKMPKKSGIQVIERIKADPNFRQIPVVVLTSSKEDLDIKQCYALGINSYIVKPVDSNNFFQSLKSLGVYWMILNRQSDPGIQA